MAVVESEPRRSGQNNRSSKMGIPEFCSISEIARNYNVSLRTLRFYEQRGLLKPMRAEGARLYDETCVAQLQKILKGKHLGFTLREIAELIQPDTDHAKTNDKLTLDAEVLQSHLHQLEQRRREINQAIKELRTEYKRLLVR